MVGDEEGAEPDLMLDTPITDRFMAELRKRQKE